MFAVARKNVRGTVKKFGLIWPDGRGERSVKKQREALINAGVREADIDDEIYAGAVRPGDFDEVVTCYLAPLGYDPARKSRPNVRFLMALVFPYFANDGKLEVIEMRKVYSGIAGFWQIITDWLDQRGHAQTATARRARKSSKNEIPKWYRDLTEDDQKEFRRRYKKRIGSDTVIGEAYGVGRQSVVRAGKALKIERVAYTPGQHRK